MSLDPLSACVIRICNANGETFGTGFVVSDSLALTCAHVVRACDGGVCVKFHTGGDKRNIEVLRIDDERDVAVLRLLPHDAPLPQNVEPAILGMTRACRGHALRIMGFATPANYEFDIVEGKILDHVQHQDGREMLRLDAKQHLPAEQVARVKGIRVGMSGAPVFDSDTERIVGMYSEFLPESPNEWAVPSETLNRICSEAKLHPPQAVEDYLAAVRKYCASLPYLTLWDIFPPKTLDEVYVPLKARSQLHKNEEEEKEYTQDPSQHEILSIAEVMRNSDHPHLLILGEPGAGKSTLLRQLAQHAWDDPGKVGLDTPHLPILVPLRRLVESEGSLEERLSHALATELLLANELPHGFMINWQEQTSTRWLILLDALDEVPDAKRPHLIQLLESLYKQSGVQRVIISSRPVSYPPRVFDAKVIAQFDLLPFTSEQIGEFARRWFNVQAKSFLQELDRVRLGELRGTPLLLTIAAKVFSATQTLPERRTKLYAQFIDIWLQEAEQRGLNDSLEQDLRDIARWGLGRLALAITERPTKNSMNDLTSIVAAEFQLVFGWQKPLAEARCERFIDVMGRRSGVFIRRGERCDWAHPTFREYLAADTLVSEYGEGLELLWKKVVSLWDERSWRQVALFALSILSDKGKNNAATKLIERVGKIGGDGLLFAGAALAEQSNANPDLTRRIGQGLSELICDENATEKHRELACFTLGQIGRESDLLDIAVNAKLRTRILKSAFTAIRQLGRINELQVLVNDGDAIDWIREQAAYALEGLENANDAARDWLTLACDVQVGLQTRLDAARASVRLGRVEEAKLSWLTMVRDERIDPRVRIDIAIAIGDLKYWDKVTTVLPSLARNKRIDPFTRVRAAEALNRLGQSAEAITILLVSASDRRTDLELCKHIIEMLHELHAADELRSIVRNPRIDLHMRERAVESLGRMKALDQLLTLTRDKRVVLRLREHAVEALSKMEATDQLLTLTRDKRVALQLRERAVQALGRMRMNDTLLTLAQSRNVILRVRERAVDILENLQDAFRLSTLADDEHMNSMVRELAAEALGELGFEEEAIGILIALAEDKHVALDARKRAVESLAYLDANEELNELKSNKSLLPKLYEHVVEVLEDYSRVEYEDMEDP